ncbi:ATP-binding protein [Desulfovibrio mangrovi]|uniref:sensor histidine kinase n=1 Tax=Desulfovibrio mangrovi TaxID=2976983 RepID=UPI0022477884|nr:ATP-binding protein [Desulfovibrio mangrovi]UZP65887.1 ATP-binding protein [Desulfovibrio mangrovi]
MSQQISPFRSSQELEETFALVQQRIAQKLLDYKAYDFSKKQTCAFNVFFDLAQEFDALEDLLTLAVLIIRSMFDVHAEIYVLNSRSVLLRYGCSTGASCAIPVMNTEGLPLTDGPFWQDKRYCIPIRGKKIDQDLLPITPVGETLGLLVLHPEPDITEKDAFFFEKYANRVGYQLHNRMLAFKHREHLEFIKNLVHDIGHNVIVPNMYFKLLFRQLDGKMKAMRHAISDLMETSISSPTLAQLDYIQHRMDEQYNEVFRHFQQTSLFLETLLRQSHFEKGRYVLHKSVVNLNDRIITPQLERFKARFDEKDIKLIPYCEGSGTFDDSILVTADVGLVSQVLANLFSNAVKYTRPTPHDEAAPNGEKSGKYLCYGVTLLPDHFGKGCCGARVNVITSGPYINAEDAPQLFKADFRGRDVGSEYGTGHGLFFAKEISRLHGGDAGYEAHPMGNCFYFTLPCDDSVPKSS